MKFSFESFYQFVVRSQSEKLEIFLLALVDSLSFVKFVMVYGVENHGLPYQSSTANCIPRDGFNGLSCENFNSANIPIHSQISTTTQNGRKRGSIVASGGCNIDLTGLTREERRSMGMSAL